VGACRNGLIRLYPRLHDQSLANALQAVSISFGVGGRAQLIGFCRQTVIPQQRDQDEHLRRLVPQTPDL